MENMYEVNMEQEKPNVNEQPEVNNDQGAAAVSTPTTGLIPPVAANPDTQAAEDMIAKGNVTAARLEKANEETAKLQAKNERLHIEKTLGGQTEAGTPPVKETPEEYAKKALAGELNETN